MITLLASFSSFLGTLWFILLVAIVCLLAGYGVGSAYPSEILRSLLRRKA